MKKIRIFHCASKVRYYFDCIYSINLIPTIILNIEDGMNYDRVISLNIFILVWNLRLGIEYNKNKQLWKQKSSM